MGRASAIHANRFEVLFDWRVGKIVRRIRIQRGVIDLCQGRRLGQEEAADLIKSRMRQIRRILVTILRRSVENRPARPLDLRPALIPQQP